jgi:Ca2+-binding EF-hand superfamily protein
MILNKLRFYINKNNLDLQMILNSMGFTQQVHEISFQDFYYFLRQVYPEITTEEADYCFKKTDTDNSSSISVSELKHMLLENGIKLDRQFQTMPTFERKESETFNRISP